MDVFISYQREDAAKAKLVSERLMNAGFSVFVDRKNLTPGERYADRLDLELKLAGAVIALWSPEALKSTWVKNECRVALQRKKLIPVAIAPLGELDLPLEFVGIEQINLAGSLGDDTSAEWDRLLQAVRAMLQNRTKTEVAADSAPDDGAPTSAGIAEERSPRERSKSRMIWTVIVSGAGALAIAAASYVGLQPSRSVAPTFLETELAKAHVEKLELRAKLCPDPSDLSCAGSNSLQFSGREGAYMRFEVTAPIDGRLLLLGFRSDGVAYPLSPLMDMGPAIGWPLNKDQTTLVPAKEHSNSLGMPLAYCLTISPQGASSETGTWIALAVQEGTQLPLASELAPLFDGHIDAANVKMGIDRIRESVGTYPKAWAYGVLDYAILPGKPQACISNPSGALE